MTRAAFVRAPNWSAIVVLFWLVALSSLAHCQPAVSPIYRQVIIAWDIKRDMALHWDDLSRKQVELAGCVVYHTAVERDGGMTTYTVDSIVAPDTVYAASPYLVSFGCRDGLVSLHEHTPTSCENNGRGVAIMKTCIVGGVDAYVCEPSPQDRRILLHDGDPFALVWCDAHALVPYYPERVNTNRSPSQ